MNSRPRTRVLVVGAGPAGLAAAARVLEKGGAHRYEVRVATLGHHFGGKADSWRDSTGRLIDHGQHIIPGWYHQMKALIRRAGVDVDAHLISNRGHTYTYEPRDGRVHDMSLARNPFVMLLRGLGFSGLTGAEKRNMAWFAMSNARVFLGLQDIEQFDDICFTAWCLANGLRASIVKTNVFRISRVGQMNWPREISAYSLLKTMREMGRDYRTAMYHYCDGGMSERFWDPIAAYIGRMGGRFEMMRKLVGLEVSGRRVRGAVFAEPDSNGHHLPSFDVNKPRFGPSVPTKPETRSVDTGFDHLISTLPVSAFQELSPGDKRFWARPEMGRLRKLRAVAPMAAQIWHRDSATRRYKSVISGLAGPLPILFDNKHVLREYRHNPKYGSVLYFAGQETGYEHWTDEQHLSRCFANLRLVPGFEHLTRSGMLHYRILRHRSTDKGYFLTEPGVQRFRPHARTSLDNLWLAGDWVRTELDFPCMETAVRSGIAAADLVLRSAR